MHLSDQHSNQNAYENGKQPTVRPPQNNDRKNKKIESLFDIGYTISTSPGANIINRASKQHYCDKP